MSRPWFSPSTGSKRFPALELLLLAAALPAVFTTAHADRRLFVWSYEAQTLGRHEAECEFYTTLSSLDRERTIGRTEAELQFEVEVGMNDRFDFAIYQVFAQAPGGPLAWDGYKLRARLRTSAVGGSFPLASVAYLEFEGTPDLQGKAVEGKWILTRDWGRQRLTLNPGFEVEREEGEWEPKAEYAAGLCRRLSDLASLGVEATGSKDGHFLGPVLAHGADDLWFALGSGWRLGHADPEQRELQVRLLLGLRVR